ncbi:MAG: hypothetical protein IJJ13_05495 [Lachnospiraceae bacterium]|nr:hypothetical protein [Lachnospiraceae bacterium]
MDQDRVLIDAFMKIMEKVEQNEKKEVSAAKQTFSEILHNSLYDVSTELHFASISGKAVAYPTAFPINPSKELFFTSFDEGSSSRAHDYMRHASLGENGYCEIRISPGEKASWEDAETQKRLLGLSRFLEIILERRIMLMNVARLPLIDMSSGLLNSHGMRTVGETLMKEGDPEQYTGIFLNLKDTKHFIHKYNDRLIEIYLVGVSHKLFSFLDTDSELGSHYGGDNFYVLLLKERLQEFQDYLNDAVIEVRDMDQTFQIPFFARLGIYEGQKGDSITNFMTGASIAFQTARRSGQDLVYFNPDMMKPGP